MVTAKEARELMPTDAQKMDQAIRAAAAKGETSVSFGEGEIPYSEELHNQLQKNGFKVNSDSNGWWLISW